MLKQNCKHKERLGNPQTQLSKKSKKQITSLYLWQQFLFGQPHAKEMVVCLTSNTSQLFEVHTELKLTANTLRWHHGYCTVWTDKVFLSPRHHDLLQQCWNRKIRWINNQSQRVKMQPEEEDFWQAEAPASAKDGTVPVTCGWAKGCQVWDKYFFKDSFSPCKMIFDPSFFILFLLFQSILHKKIMFQKEKGGKQTSFEQKPEEEVSIFS